jgi:hypothetical protein
MSLPCCLLRPDGAVVALTDQDGSQLFYVEPSVPEDKTASAPLTFVNLADTVYTRYRIVDYVGHGDMPPVGYVYALRLPTGEETARALAFLTAAPSRGLTQDGDDAHPDAQ